MPLDYDQLQRYSHMLYVHTRRHNFINAASEFSHGMAAPAKIENWKTKEMTSLNRAIQNQQAREKTLENAWRNSESGKSTNMSFLAYLNNLFAKQPVAMRQLSQTAQQIENELNNLQQQLIQIVTIHEAAWDTTTLEYKFDPKQLQRSYQEVNEVLSRFNKSIDQLERNLNNQQKKSTGQQAEFTELFTAIAALRKIKPPKLPSARGMRAKHTKPYLDELENIMLLIEGTSTSIQTYYTKLLLKNLNRQNIQTKVEGCLVELSKGKSNKTLFNIHDSVVIQTLNENSLQNTVTLMRGQSMEQIINQVYGRKSLNQAIMKFSPKQLGSTQEERYIMYILANYSRWKIFPGTSLKMVNNWAIRYMDYWLAMQAKNTNSDPTTQLGPADIFNINGRLVYKSEILKTFAQNNFKNPSQYVRIFSSTSDEYIYKNIDEMKTGYKTYTQMYNGPHRRIKFNITVMRYTMMNVLRNVNVSVKLGQIGKS